MLKNKVVKFLVLSFSMFLSLNSFVRADEEKVAFVCFVGPLTSGKTTFLKTFLTGCPIDIGTVSESTWDTNVFFKRYVLKDNTKQLQTEGRFSLEEPTNGLLLCMFDTSGDNSVVEGLTRRYGTDCNMNFIVFTIDMSIFVQRLKFRNNKSLCSKDLKMDDIDFQYAMDYINNISNLYYNKIKGYQAILRNKGGLGDVNYLILGTKSDVLPPTIRDAVYEYLVKGFKNDNDSDTNYTDVMMVSITKENWKNSIESFKRLLLQKLGNIYGNLTKLEEMVIPLSDFDQMKAASGTNNANNANTNNANTNNDNRRCIIN